MAKHTSLDRHGVIEVLTRVVTPGIKLMALADELGLRKRDHAALRELLADMIADDVVHAVPGGAYALVPAGRPGDRKAAGGRRARPASLAPAEKARKAAGATRARPGAPTLPWKAAKPPAEARAQLAQPAPKPSYLATLRGGAAAAPPPPAPPPARAATAPVPSASPARPVPPAPAAPAAPAGSIEGRITVHPAGYGFVATDDGDVFIPAKYRATSLDGDRVVVTTWPGVKGTEGRVVSVVARGRARLTGIVRRAGRTEYLEPDDPRILADYGRVAIDGYASGAGSAADGTAVVVEITRYPEADSREMAGRVIKVLGSPDDPRTEIEKIIAVAGIPVEFPPEALAQAAATPQELVPSDFLDRIDLRARRFCTIDPETARDFDDALCIERGPHGGPRVWIAVADVSHYVRWDDALDRESTLRGVSCYLPDRVISMLPLELSANICSLNPNVDRCAMVVRIDFTDAGEIVDTGFAAAVIRSHARLDYPGAAAALHGDFRGRRAMYREWLDELTALDTLAQTLRKGRRARGALDLELPEAKVILDADDPRLVRDVVKAKGDPQVKRAYELVEEFMIAANEAVGRYFRQRGADTVWRVHAPPKRERLETLVELLHAFGIDGDVDEMQTPLGMKRIIDEVNALPSAKSLSFLVLRSLTQAVWDVVGVGHFGLASADYLHFTSPIRRYPDLLVHRLLKHHLHREGQASGGGHAALPPARDRLAELARNASMQERRAMEAEREAVSMYRCFLVREQVGDQFSATVSAVTSFGLFVEIDEPYVEGLIRLDSFAEPMIFDEVHLRLTGRLTGMVLTLGDRVVVEIQNVSVPRRRIDLALVSGGTVRKGGVATHAGMAARAPKRPAMAPPMGRHSLPPRGRDARPAHGQRPEPAAHGRPRPAEPAPAAFDPRKVRKANRAAVKAQTGGKPGAVKGGRRISLGVSHRGRAGAKRAKPGR
jgi:ribonuclease R